MFQSPGYPPDQLARIAWMRDRMLTLMDWLHAGGRDSVHMALKDIINARGLIDHDRQWSADNKLGKIGELDEYALLHELHDSMGFKTFLRPTDDVLIKVMERLHHYYANLYQVWKEMDDDRL